MKRLVLCLIVAGIAPLAMSQTSAQAKSAPVMNWPKPSATPSEAQAMRLEILNQEREEINKKLSESMTELPKSKDMQESLKVVSRRQADLMAIDREIENAEGRDRKGSAPSGARKPVAQAAGDVTASQGQLVEAKQANTEFEAWDVFKNFGEKVDK
jgi:hypothetical protein